MRFSFPHAPRALRIPDAKKSEEKEGSSLGKLPLTRAWLIKETVLRRMPKCVVEASLLASVRISIRSVGNPPQGQEVRKYPDCRDGKAR